MIFEADGLFWGQVAIKRQSRVLEQPPTFWNNRQLWNKARLRRGGWPHDRTIEELRQLKRERAAMVEAMAIKYKGFTPNAQATS